MGRERFTNFRGAFRGLGGMNSVRYLRPVNEHDHNTRDAAQ